MSSFGEFLSSWWKGDGYGTPPEVITDYLVSGDINRGLKWKISFRANKIIAKHGSNHKFGKSGQPKKRAKANDYTHEEPYTKMFLMYESPAEDNVSKMEVHYILKYQDLTENDNVSTTEEHKIVSLNGKYYMYLVI
jgi:hypothetical protein